MPPSVDISAHEREPSAPVRVGVWTAHLCSLLVLLLWAAAAGVLPAYVLPGPLAVMQRAFELAASRLFLLSVLFSVWHICASVALAFFFGLLLVLLMHFAPVVRLAINSRLNPFLSSFSTIGWIFLAVIWFGLNDFNVIFVVTVTLLPFALSNLRAAVEELDVDVIELAHSLSRRRFRIVRIILLPLMVPYLFATLRICLGVAWKVVLTAELFGGSSGLGYQISRARADLDIPAIFAIIAIIVAIVYFTDKFLLAPMQLRLRRNYAAS